MTATAQLLIESLPVNLGARLLAAGVDDAGTPLEAHEDPDGGAPLRCCLRDSRPGERLVLAAVTPPGPRDAYREVGPVFLHAQPCAGPLDEVPPFWSTRRQVLRTYDAAGHLSGGEVAEPETSWRSPGSCSPTPEWPSCRPATWCTAASWSPCADRDAGGPGQSFATGA